MKTLSHQCLIPGVLMGASPPMSGPSQASWLIDQLLGFTV